jgi:peptidyl-prolyl cis-trans isomerase D
MVLQSIRDRLHGIIAVFIFSILIIPFVFVGVNSYFTSDAVNSVAVVNEQEISINDFNQSFQNYRRRMQSLMGTNFDAEQFDQAIIRRQHLDTMIDQELLSQVSIEAGLSVDSGRLAEAIREVPGFQVDGEFNTDVYQSRLAAQGLIAQQFENNMRAQMILGQLPTAISTSAISTDWELNDFVRMQEQKRAFKAILFPAQASDPVGGEVAAEPDAELADAGEEQVDPDVANTEIDPALAEAVIEEEVIEEEVIEEEVIEEEVIEEEAVVAWYESHPDDYRSAERVVIQYLELDAATMGGEVATDEEALLAQFEQQEARFITPESRQASHILIEVDSQAPEAEVETARQQAEDLVARALAGEDFAALAVEFSQDAGSAAQGGDLGWVEPGFMVQAFEDGLYELTLESPVSQPVQSGFGWHVIYLRDIQPAEGMTFAEARPVLLAEYQEEEDERRFIEQADRLVDIIYEDPTTLDAAAAELDLVVQEAGPFSRAGGEGFEANSEVVKASFSDLVLLQGAASDPVDLGENHLVMILLKEHLPEALMALDEVRDQVVQSVRQQRAMEAAEARADEFLALAVAGTDLSVIAADSGLEVLEAEALMRDDAEIRADLRKALFQMDVPGEGGPLTEILELSDGYALVQLQSVSDGELLEEDVLKSQSFNRRLANSTASSETYSFLRMLRSQSEITVYEDRL